MLDDLARPSRVSRPRRLSWVWVAAAVTVAALVPASALGQEGEDASKPARLLGVDLTRKDEVSIAQKKYAKGVAANFVCLCGTCPKESLATCDCGWAGTGRKTIELALLDGKSDEAIIKAYRQAYGHRVFAKPPGGIEAAIAVVPYVLGVAMLLIMVAFGISNRRRGVQQRAVPVPVEHRDDEDEASRILRRELEEMD